MRIFCLLILAVASGVSFSQKLKDRTVEFRYLKAPLTPTDLPKNYHFVVTEQNVNAQGVVSTLTVKSKTSAYDSRSNFYKEDSGLGNINGFNDIAYNKDSVSMYVEMNVGLLDDGLRQQIKIQNNNGADCYQLQIPFRLPITFTVSKPDGTIFYERDTKDTTFTFIFPKDYKPTAALVAYMQVADLNAAYPTNRIGFFAEVRHNILTKWIYQTKMDFSSRFARQLTKMNVDVYWVKEKKGGYEDLETLVGKMDTLFAQLDRNHEKSFSKNWHSQFYETQFTELANEWNQLIQDDAQKSTPRFDIGAKWGLHKNYLWCLFFAGNTDEVLLEAAQLEADRLTDPKRYDGVRFDNMVRIISDYKLRFVANLELFEGN